MKYLALRNYTILLVALMVLAGCSAHCNCPVCPVAGTQPQTTIIHEPE